jgi:hypothetical protein
VNAPRDISHVNLFPGLLAFSAPITKTESQRPDDIEQKAETTAFVPELQRLSTRYEIFGLIPRYSHSILELY